TISIADGITTTTKGAMLTVQANGNDAEDGPNGVVYTFSVLDPVAHQPLDPCDYDGTAVRNQYAVIFYRTGIFEVDAVVSDKSHASAEAHVMVTITDAPPRFVDKAKLAPTSPGNACGLYAAGDVVTLGLSGPMPGVPAVGDADAGSYKIGCGPSETLTFTWRISDWPGGARPVLTGYDGLGCTAPRSSSGTTLDVSSPMSQVCLWTDPMLAGATGMYSVVLDVSDGTTTVTSPVGGVSVAADEPPCITGTNPVAGSYVVDRTQLQQFFVDGAVDDRDLFGAGIAFAWSVWREADPTWRAVPSWALSTYQLDVSSFGVGEKVRVRVEAIDRTGALVSPAICAPDADDCIVASCASAPNACHKWKTWDLELR
ncbi:MAG TPA: hypothetical protein VF945_00495, partial [Polyangia bacterium]